VTWRSPDTYQPAGLRRGTATSTSTLAGTTSGDVPPVELEAALHAATQTNLEGVGIIDQPTEDSAPHPSLGWRGLGGTLAFASKSMGKQWQSSSRLNPVRLSP
jgi:hypothetical protein